MIVKEDAAGPVRRADGLIYFNDQLSTHFLQTLCRLDTNAEEIVPVLAENLTNKCDLVRIYSAYCLGKFGAKAKHALSRLEAALNDGVDKVRENAAQAIKLIKG